MTFEDIQNANKSIKTTPIRGKEYAEVNQRIKAFRMVCPNGCINTNIERMEDGLIVMTASVFDEDAHLLGVGTAYEKEGSSQINKSSYIENCETSAVGRALGMCGFGIDVSVASAEEMENAITQQAAEEPIDEAKVKTLEKLIPKHGQTIEKTCEVFKVNNLSELTNGQFKRLMDKMGEEEVVEDKKHNDRRSG